MNILVAGAFLAQLSVADGAEVSGWTKSDQEDANGPVDEVKKCLLVGTTCVKESYLSISKVKCVYDMGKCLMTASTCGFKCIDELNVCWVNKIWSGKGPDCVKEFENCFSNWCMMEKCKAEQYTCLSKAKTQLEKMQCYYGMGKCLTIKGMKCCLKCVPAIVACTIRNIFYPVEFAKCYITYVNCAIESCKKDFPSETKKMDSK